MKHYVSLKILLLFILSFDSQLFPLLTYDSEEWGNAYLIQVINHTLSDLQLIFPDDPGSKRIIRPGATLGKPPIIDNKKNGAAAATAGSIVKSFVEKYVPTISDRNTIRSDQYPTIENSDIKRKPVITGFGVASISGVTNAVNLELQPMKGLGGAWFNQTDFSVPSSLSFGIFVKDKGSGAIVFSDNPKAGVRMMIEFGANDNNSINVTLDGKSIASVNTANFPFAKLFPGRFNNYWISFTETDLILGYGPTVGHRCLICVTVPELEKIIKTVGLLSFDVPINFATIKVLPPLKIESIADKNLLTQGFKDTQFKLISNGIGSLIVDSGSKGSADFNLKLQSEGPGYATIENKNNNCVVKVFSGDAGSAVILEEKFSFADGFQNIILSLSNNTLVVAQANENYSKTRLIKVIPRDLWNYCTAFSLNGDFNKEAKIFLGSPLVLSLNFDFLVDTKLLRASENLLVIRPLEYELDQKGPAIVCTDKIGKQSFVLGKAAQQQAYYSFDATISNDGILDIRSELDPINPTKMVLKFVVGLLGIAQQEFASRAMSANDLGEEEYDSEMASLDFFSAHKTELQQTAFNIGWSMATAGAAIASGIGKATIEDSFRSATNSYVLQEKMKNKKNITSDIPPEAKINKSMVDQQIGLILKKEIKTREDYDFVMGEVQSAIGLVNHSYVATGGVRAALISAVEKLFTFKQKFLDMDTAKDEYGRVIPRATKVINIALLRLLVDICNNRYLVDSSSKSELVLSNKIFSYINLLSQSYFQANLEDPELKDLELVIPASGSFVYWTRQKLSSGSGSVIFKARGAGDFGIFLIDSRKAEELKTRMLNDNEMVYQIMFGENQNKDLTMRTAVNVPPVLTVKNTSDNNFSLDQLDFKDYWINLDKGKLSAGVGHLGLNPCFSWTDSYEKINDLIVGIGSPLSDADIKGFAAGPSIETLSLDLLNLIDVFKDEKIAAQKYLTLTPGSNNLGSRIFKNSAGTLFTKIFLEKNYPIWHIMLKNSKLKTEYNFSFELRKKKTVPKVSPDISQESLDNVPAEQEVSKPSAKFEIFVTVMKNGKKVKDGSFDLKSRETPFCLELANGVIRLSCNMFWESGVDFEVMFPELSTGDVEINISVDKYEVKILQPAVLDQKNKINYGFLSFLSDGVFGIVESPAVIAAKKSQKVQESINGWLEEEKKQNPLFKDLSKEDSQVFADLLYYSAMDDKYDKLAFDDLEYDVGKARGWEDLLTSDPLVKDKLGSDTLGGADEEAPFQKPEEHLSGAMQKLNMMSLSQQLFMFGSDAKQTLGFLGSSLDGISYLNKKLSNYYKFHPEEEAKDKEKASAFPLVADAKKLKNSLKGLANLTDFNTVDSASTKAVNEYYNNKKNGAYKHEPLQEEIGTDVEKEEIREKNKKIKLENEAKKKKEAVEKEATLKSGSIDKLAKKMPGTNETMTGIDNFGNQRVILKNDFAEAKEQYKMWKERKKVLASAADKEKTGLALSTLESDMKNAIERAATQRKDLTAQRKVNKKEEKKEIKAEYDALSRKDKIKSGAVKTGKIVAKFLPAVMGMGSSSETENSDNVVGADIADGPDTSNMSKTDLLKMQHGIDYTASPQSDGSNTGAPSVTAAIRDAG